LNNWEKYFSRLEKKAALNKPRKAMLCRRQHSLFFPTKQCFFHEETEKNTRRLPYRK